MNHLPETTKALEAAVPELINWLRQAAPQGADFIQTQAPLFAEELIRYAVWNGAILAIVGLLLVIVGGVFFFERWKYSVTGAGIFLGIITIITGFVLIPIGISRAIKPLIVPRIVIVEEAARLTRGDNW